MALPALRIAVSEGLDRDTHSAFKGFLVKKDVEDQKLPMALRTPPAARQALWI